MMDKEEILSLVKKYNDGNCTQDEINLLETWYVNHNEFSNPQIHPATMEQDLLHVSQNLPGLIHKKVLWPRIAAAASLLLFLSFGGYLVLHKKSNQQTAKNQSIDIAPGHNQATLTLTNGQKIVLTKGLKGALAQQGNVLISVEDALRYTSSGKNSGKKVEYNTMSTANGEESPFPLVLADGTKVWLNAKSSIRFPTAFTGNARTVEVTGEAYFEVVHNNLKPFKVTVKGQTIEDLGTQFNINAYDDEPVGKTTLLEGSIEISVNEEMAILKPGQQAQVKTGSKINIIEHSDTEEATAWRNGLFKFNHADIKTVMRQFARWYDVDVDYEGAIPNEVISGEIYRNVNASQALAILKYLNIHYKIERDNGNNKITITP